MTRASLILVFVAGVLAVCFTCAACSGGGGDDNPTSPSNPTAGLDTSQRQMRDGAGNPGPVRVRLLNVTPILNARVVGRTRPLEQGCGTPQGADCMGYVLELCVDSLQNPTGSPILNQMSIIATFSTDGTTPILSRGGPFQVAGRPFQVAFEIIPSGTCRTLTQTLSGNTDMRMPFPTEGEPRFFMLVAAYGGTDTFSINQAACPTPTPTTPTAVSPACALRVAYDLGYHF